MSNLVNKAKDALSGHNNNTTTTGGTAVGYDDPRSTNAGPHGSNTMNKADPRIDSDLDNRGNPAGHVGGGGFGGSQGTHGTYTGTGGAGLTSGGSGLTGTHAGSTNAGPHSSNLANKVDPRVDSDLDNRNDPTSRVGGYGTQGTHTGAGAGVTGGSGFSSGGSGIGGTQGTSSTHQNNPQSTNAGPHSSNLANKLDPRVDSDRDNRNDPTSRTGGYGQTQDTYGSGTTGGAGLGNTSGMSGAHQSTTTGGIGGTQGISSAQHNNPQSTNAGPHSSNMANKLDPRVDSDRDNRNDPSSRVGGYGDQQTSGGAGYGTQGTSGIGSTGTHGVGSTGTHGATGTGVGVGSTQSGATTAAGVPSTQKAAHESSLLNKLDPRVKADKEGNPLH